MQKKWLFLLAGALSLSSFRQAVPPESGYLRRPLRLHCHYDFLGIRPSNFTVDVGYRLGDGHRDGRSRFNFSIGILQTILSRVSVQELTGQSFSFLATRAKYSRVVSVPAFGDTARVSPESNQQWQSR